MIKYVGQGKVTKGTSALSSLDTLRASISAACTVKIASAGLANESGASDIESSITAAADTTSVNRHPRLLDANLHALGHPEVARQGYILI